MAIDGQTGMKIIRSRTIRRSAAELFAFWRNLENLPRIVKHPITITTTSPTESHWAVSAPVGDDPVEWDAVIINEEPGALIAWRSAEGADVANAGTVRFEPAPADLGTEVTVTLEYDPPGGRIGAWVAKLTAEEPGRQVADALRRLQALMEAGEIPTTEGQPVGEPQRSKLNKEKTK